MIYTVTISGDKTYVDEIEACSEEEALQMFLIEFFGEDVEIPYNIRSGDEFMGYGLDVMEVEDE